MQRHCYVKKIVLATLGGSVAFVDHTGRIEKINFHGKSKSKFKPDLEV